MLLIISRSTNLRDIVSANKMFTAIEINGPIAFLVFRFFFHQKDFNFSFAFCWSRGRLIVTEDFQLNASADNSQQT